ncbi:MAG: DNA recombination protein RmuC [Candidatus Tyrphobacter sp.]
MTPLLLFIIGLLLGSGIAWFVAERRLRAEFEAAARSHAESLDALIERTKNELRDATAARASERVGDLMRPMSEQLTAFHALVGGLLARTESLESAATSLTSQTSSLVSALRNPTTRGKWGEMQLRNVVERAGMLSHCDFDEQQTIVLDGVRVRPDMTVHLPGDRCVFVDAKVPIETIQQALETSDEGARRELVNAHAKSLRAHVDDLSRRGYQTANGSVEFVIMFVPGESFLSAGFNEDPLLIDYAVERGVIIAGPVQLIGLLRMFATGWQVVKQEENAKRIAAIGRELYERAQRFAGHLVKVRKGLEDTVGAFNAAVGSYESRLLPQGRKLKDEAALPTEDFPEIGVIDSAARPITAIDAAGEPARLPRTQGLF